MRTRDGWTARAALAVVALYGLLLSTFLGAMAPTGPMLPAGLLCQTTGGEPAEPHAPVHRSDCCVAGCVATSAAPPASTAPARPPAAWHVVAHDRVTATVALHRPAGHRPPPRGPPLA